MSSSDSLFLKLHDINLEVIFNSNELKHAVTFLEFSASTEFRYYTLAPCKSTSSYLCKQCFGANTVLCI